MHEFEVRMSDANAHFWPLMKKMRNAVANPAEKVCGREYFPSVNFRARCVAAAAICFTEFFTGGKSLR
jgi:hypothetical protein